MAEITFRHELYCNAETYWEKCVFCEDYNRHLHIDILKFHAYETRELKDEPTQRSRRVHIEPPLRGVPGPVVKLLGDRVSYTEIGVWDKATQRYRFKVVPSTLAEKTTIEGELYCEPTGGGHIVRIATIGVEVRIFGIGKLIEERILHDLGHSYAIAAKFTNEYVKEKGL